MISISTVKNARYYSDLAHQDDYYHRGKEPAGIWHGKGAQAFGLAGEVERKKFLHLSAGLDPDGKEALVQNAGKKEEYARRCGWDVTFSAPKSVSALWAAAPDELREKISSAHREAVKATLDYLEEHLEGETEAAKQLFFVLFQPFVSRTRASQLSSQVLMINLRIMEDGRACLLKSNEIFKLRRMIGAFYRDDLTRRLERIPGVERGQE